MAVLEAPRLPPIRGTAGKISDAACFSPKTDRTHGETLTCECGANAVGGVPVEFKQSVMDKAIGLFRFTCANCRNDSSYAITAGIMYPSWKVVIRQGPGLYWLRHLTEAEQSDVVSGY